MATCPSHRSDLAPKPSAMDLISENFDHVQTKYIADFQKENLVGYDEALMYLDQFLQFRHDQTLPDNNFPFIITADAGCGKTHLVNKWLMRLQEGVNQYGEKNAKEVKLKNEKKVLPNLLPTGDILFTFFAGVDNINSRIELTQLKPPHQRAAKPSSNDLKQDKSQVNVASDLNKYQTFIYDTMTKFRQTYDIDLRVEILDDMLRTNFRKWLEIANKLHKEMMGAKS